MELYNNITPVMYYDPSGHFFLAILGTLILGAAIGGLAGGIVALATGQNFWAGVAGGAVSGLLSTVGMALAVTTGGLGGLALAAGFGFLSGYGGNIIQQGIENGWNNINLREARIAGYISGVINILTFGVTNFAMRNSVGVFDEIFDKSLKFSTRLANSLSMSLPSFLATGMFSAPMTTISALIDITRYYGSGKPYGNYFSIQRGAYIF